MEQKVLLIAPLFFNYYKEMIEELKQMGFIVDYICDAPSNSNISKAIGRINKNLIKGQTKKYFNDKVLPSINNKKYDYVLVVGGMTFSFTPEMMGKIKEMNEDAIFCLYQWDSEKNLPYSTVIHKYFDRVFSFDLNDCAINSMYKFLPLFYTDLYKNIGLKENVEFKYDCSYVGTAHPQKYKDINEISIAVKKIMPKQLIYHYMPSKLKYIYHKILSPEFKNAKLINFEYNKLSSDDLNQIFLESKCVLDAPQAGQTGLTIRTIECLGAKRKLITTNKDIKKYDFYNENNIYVFDGKLDDNSKFFLEDYIELSNDVYEKYSLRSWLKTMLYEEK